MQANLRILADNGLGSVRVVVKEDKQMPNSLHKSRMVEDADEEDDKVLSGSMVGLSLCRPMLTLFAAELQ